MRPGQPCRVPAVRTERAPEAVYQDISYEALPCDLTIEDLRYVP